MLQLCTNTPPKPARTYWYQPKYDGVRVLMSGGHCETRNGCILDAARPIARALHAIAPGVSFDGELVGASYRHTMSLIRVGKPSPRLRFICWQAWDIGTAPLYRDAYARAVALCAGIPCIEVPPIIEASGRDAQRIMRRMVRAGHEGAVAKRPDLSIAPGRRTQWHKLKPVETVDLPICHIERTSPVSLDVMWQGKPTRVWHGIIQTVEFWHQLGALAKERGTYVGAVVEIELLMGGVGGLVVRRLRTDK